MRKVTFGGANSLDNYIARKDGAYDWILGSKEANAYLREYWKTIDTIVMGRKTYEFALRSGSRAGSYGMTTYVVSRTLKPSSDKSVQIVREDAAA